MSPPRHFPFAPKPDLKSGLWLEEAGIGVPSLRAEPMSVASLFSLQGDPHAGRAIQQPFEMGARELVVRMLTNVRCKRGQGTGIAGLQLGKSVQIALGRWGFILAGRERLERPQRLGLAPQHQVADRPAAEIIDLCGQTDLATLAALMSMSAATVANDSGAMHLAAAVGTKVVAIFGPTDYQHTSPLFASANAPAPTIISSDVWCRPCMLRECPLDHRCMTQISARSVFEALTLS